MRATTSMWKGPVMNTCSAAEDEFGAGLLCRDCRTALNRSRRTSSCISVSSPHRPCPPSTSVRKTSKELTRSTPDKQKLRFSLEESQEIKSEATLSPRNKPMSPGCEPALVSTAGRFFFEKRPNCTHEYEPFQAFSTDSKTLKGLNYFRAGMTAVLDAVLEAISEKRVTIVNFG